MTEKQTDHLWYWIYLALGTAGIWMLCSKLLRSLEAGTLSFVWKKYNFVFFGSEAAAIYVAWFVLCLLFLRTSVAGLRRNA